MGRGRGGDEASELLELAASDNAGRPQLSAAGEAALAAIGKTAPRELPALERALAQVEGSAAEATGGRDDLVATFERTAAYRLLLDNFDLIPWQRVNRMGSWPWLDWNQRNKSLHRSLKSQFGAIANGSSGGWFDKLEVAAARQIIAKLDLAIEQAERGGALRGPRPKQAQALRMLRAALGGDQLPSDSGNDFFEPNANPGDGAALLAELLRLQLLRAETDKAVQTITKFERIIGNYVRSALIDEEHKQRRQQQLAAELEARRNAAGERIELDGKIELCLDDDDHGSYIDDEPTETVMIGEMPIESYIEMAFENLGGGPYHEKSYGPLRISIELLPVAEGEEDASPVSVNVKSGHVDVTGKMRPTTSREIAYRAEGGSLAKAIRQQIKDRGLGRICTDGYAYDAHYGPVKLTISQLP